MYSTYVTYCKTGSEVKTSLFFFLQSMSEILLTASVLVCITDKLHGAIHYPVTIFLSLNELIQSLTFIFPLRQRTSFTFPYAADELRRDGFYVLIHSGGRGDTRRSPTVLLQGLEVQRRQLQEKTVSFLFTQLRPELQDVGLSCSLQTLPHLLQRKHFAC